MGQCEPISSIPLTRSIINVFPKSYFLGSGICLAMFFAHFLDWNYLYNYTECVW